WKAASRELGTLGAPASCRPWVGHGGSRRQEEFLKPRHFVVQTRCGRDARAPRKAALRGRSSPNGFALPRATQPPLAAWKRQHQDFRLCVLD
ncbi:MAG: hypothetical protein, partial [Olavius algarvensis Gamma 1 endosymbiont]